MSELLLTIFQTNEGINYNLLIPIVLGYVFIFWLVVSGWVYYDARKRYHNKKLVWAIFGLNIVFGVPFFLLYILFRPETEEFFGAGISESAGGVNVPLVNFVGKDGVVMSFQLKINSDKLTPVEESEMKIDINFATNDANKQLLPPTSDVKVDGVEVKTESQIVAPAANPVANLAGGIKGKWSGFMSKFARKPKEVKVEVTAEAKLEAEKQEEKQAQNLVQRFLQGKKNKKKKNK